jgi:hypothetical protein
MHLNIASAPHLILIFKAKRGNRVKQLKVLRVNIGSIHNKYIAFFASLGLIFAVVAGAFWKVQEFRIIYGNNIVRAVVVDKKSVSNGWDIVVSYNDTNYSELLTYGIPFKNIVVRQK